MRAAFVVWTALIAATATARAGSAPASGPAVAGDVAVIVVGGGAAAQDDLAAFVTTWLRAHGHKVAGAPLDDSGVHTLEDCLAINDLRCARVVVDQRSTAAEIVYVRVEVSAKADGALGFAAYWFAKSHEASVERQSCARCTGDAWHAVVDDILGTLAQAEVQTGHLAIRSTPDGLAVQLDDQDIGTAPLERDVAAGKHHLALVRGGRVVGERKVTVAANETAEIELRADAAERPSRVAPVLVIAGGVACLVAGSAFLYRGSHGHADSTPIGLGFIAAGISAGAAGAIWLARTSAAPAPAPASGPVAAVLPGGAYVGWMRSF